MSCCPSDWKHTEDHMDACMQEAFLNCVVTPTQVLVQYGTACNGLSTEA